MDSDQKTDLTSVCPFCRREVGLFKAIHNKRVAFVEHENNDAGVTLTCPGSNWDIFYGWKTFLRDQTMSLRDNLKERA